MTNKILFLDVDGVLNSKEFALSKRNKNPGGLLGMDPVATTYLADIVKKTNCNIVVSSTWRLHGIGKGSSFYKQLSLVDVSGIIMGSIIGATPDGYNHKSLQDIDKVSRIQRGDEIRVWIEENDFKGAFVIVDDDSDMANLKDHLVQTRFELGLTRELANEIIYRLNSS